MYTWELKNFVNERRGQVTREEYIKLVSKVDNPQIVDVVVVDDGDVMKTVVITSDDGSFSFNTPRL